MVESIADRTHVALDLPDTFETGGACPACRHLWRETQCLACHRMSPHVDWYRDLPPVDALLDAIPAERA